MWLLLAGSLMSSNLIAQHIQQSQSIEPQDVPHRVHQQLKNPTHVADRNIKLIPDHQQAIFTSDTSWSYDEQLLYGNDQFQPTGYSITRDIGTTDAFVRQYDQFFWMIDSEDWELNSRRYTYYNDNFADSAVNYGYFEGEITYGNRTRYSRNPEDGASLEYYQDDYYVGMGWTPISRHQYYTSDDNNVFWLKTYNYDQFVQDYVLSEIFSGEQGELELGGSFSYTENKRYYNTRIEYWVKSMQTYNEDSLIISDTNYELNSSEDDLIPVDSTAYAYLGEYSEATTYYFSEGFGWEPNEYTRSYVSAYETKDGTRTDSILTYEIVYDNENNPVPGSVSRKTIFTYDTNENMVEETYSHNFGSEFRISAQTFFEYELIAGEYRQVEEKYYTANDDLTQLHLTRDISTRYTAKGEYYEQTQFVTSADGDTTSATKNQVIETDEARYSLDYFWDEDRHEFQRYYLMVHGMKEPVIQSAMLDERGYSTRRIEVSGGYPAVFNDGPIFIELGDTLDITLSAHNPDLSTPAVTVTQLPATATFDPQTQRFYWIVDDLAPEPMIYTVSDGLLSYSTTVLFMPGELVSSNDVLNELPSRIELFQNYPNPFNPETTIRFNLASANTVSLVVYNVLGQLVVKLMDEQLLSAGTHSIQLSGENLSSGVYFYQITVNGYSKIKSMTLIK